MQGKYAAVPEELKILPQWVIHTDKKIPYNPKTLKRAKSNDSTTWGSFEQAVAQVKGAYVGIGFELNGSIVGIDIDHCVNPLTGEASPFAQSIIDYIDSYTEYSPSGEGIHIFVRGEIPGDGRKRSDLGLEIYKNRRYLTVTGRPYQKVKPLATRYEQITNLYEKHFYKVAASESGTETERPDMWADDVLIEKAGQAENGELFQKLWLGKWEDNYPSQSEADLALCGLLAYWTGNDKEQIDRLFRSSGLMRDKWDEKRGNCTYGETTINKAIQQPAVIPANKLKIISATELQEMYIPPIKWLVKDLIPQGLTMIVAPPKSGKSWLMLDLCLSIAAGKPFLGHECEKGGCLYLALEDSKRRLKDRMSRLLPFDEKAPRGFDYVTEISQLNVGFQEQLEGYICSHKNLRLIVVDTFQYVRGVTNNRNVYAQDYTDLAAIKKIADSHDIGIIVVHHTKKAKDESDPFLQISGTNGLLGALDTALVMERQKRADTQAVLHITGRDVDMQDLLISFNKNSCKWEYISSAEENAKQQEYETYRNDMLVMTIRGLITEEGIWEGSATEILEAGFFGETENPHSIGKRITALEPLLMEYDGISHKAFRSNGKRGHIFRFEILF